MSSTKMKVEVRLYSDFRKYLPPGSDLDRCIVETEQGVTVAQLLDPLMKGNEKPRVITVNNTNRKEDHLVCKGDVIKVFPIARGG